MAVSARSFWKGHLRLALVTIPIRLVSATASEDKIAFHQVDRETKERIRYQKITAESGKTVKPEDIVQGFEFEPGNYILLEDDELDALKLSTRHTVELLEFVDACSIDPLYFDRPYYVLPDGEIAEEGYRVIRDALQASKKYGIGQLAMRGRENLVALKPCGAGLLLETMRYESEIKTADAVFSDIGTDKLKSGLIEMAQKLIEERSSEFNPSAYKNHYAQAVKELVARKKEGGQSVAVSGGDDAQTSGTVIDFMEALRRSTEQSKPASKSSGAKKPVAAAAAHKVSHSKKTAAPARSKDLKQRADKPKRRRTAT